MEATPGHAYIDPVIFSLMDGLEGVKRVLDLGCGNGTLSAGLIQRGYQVVGCDPSADGVAIAREQVPQGRFEVCGVYDDPDMLGEKDFDLVVSEEVVEHLYRPSALPQFAHEALRPGGYLIVTTPYYGYLRNIVLSIFNRWDHHHTVWWDHGHIKLFSRKTLTRLLESQGFRVMAFRGAGNLPYLWRNMILLARKEA